MARIKRRKLIRKILIIFVFSLILLLTFAYLFTPLKMIPKIFFGEPLKELTQEQRIENFEYIYQKFDKYYPFFQLKNIDWESLHNIYLPKIKAAPTTQAYWDTLDTWLSELHDQHVRIGRQGESLKNMFDFEKRWYPPIDIELTPTKIVIGYADDPSIIGAEVLKIGQKLVNVYIDSICNRKSFLKYRTPRIRKKEALQSILRNNKKNSNLELTLRLRTGTIDNYSFKRSIVAWKWLQDYKWENKIDEAYLINIEAIDWRVRYGRLKDTNIGYIKIGTLLGVKKWGSISSGLGFFIQTALFKNNPIRKNLEKALTYLKGIDAIIIDLRGNTGGNEGIGHWFASHFIRTDSLLIKYHQYRDGPNHGDFIQRRAIYLKPTPEIWEIPAVLLIDSDVLSSAEGTTSAFQANPYVTLVGDTTRGATANPMTVNLPHGGSVSVSRWIAYTHDGNVIESNGIPPHEVVFQTQKAFNLQMDNILERAIQIAKQNKLRK